jgi:hypothetical protein
MLTGTSLLKVSGAVSFIFSTRKIKISYEYFNDVTNLSKNTEFVPVAGNTCII